MLLTVATSLAPLLLGGACWLPFRLEHTLQSLAAYHRARTR